MLQKSQQTQPDTARLPIRTLPHESMSASQMQEASCSSVSCLQEAEQIQSASPPLLTRVSENILLVDRLACDFHSTLRESDTLAVSEIYSVSLTIFTFPVTPSE